MVVKGVEIKCKKLEEENYLSMIMSFNGIKIDNRTSTLEENKEINILKINFATTHIHSTYNTKT